MLYLADRDPMTAVMKEEDGKLYVIDGVCWNDGHLVIDHVTKQQMLLLKLQDCGLKKTYVKVMLKNEGIKVSPGNNDHGPNDWEKILNLEHY